MSIGVRINYLRENYYDKKMSMATFAKEIGVSPATINQWEKGNTSVPQTAINVIVSKFAVNETWLLTGEGEMKTSASRAQELAKITTELYNADPDGTMYKFMKELSKLTPETWKDIGNFINKVASRSDEPE